MFAWTPYAFVRISLFFIGGILLGIHYPDIPVAWLISGAGSLLIGFVILALNRSTSRGFWVGFVALVLLLAGGYLHVRFKTAATTSDHLLHFDADVEAYKVTIDDLPRESEKTWKVTGILTAVYDSTWQMASGSLQLYFSKEIFDEPFAYGDVLIVYGKPQQLTPPSNPGEFDYKTFLTYRNIYHQHFIKNDPVIRIDHRPPSQLYAWSLQARQYFEFVLEHYVPDPESCAVAKALVLGVKDDLAQEQMRAYSSAGAMHVLAVSGLHVGILYGLLLLLIKPVTKIKYGKWILAIVSVLVLWSYAFITGLSPSVLRAVTMFSFVALAKPLHYRTNIYNILGVAAFCLLIYDPYFIMSVGFQLSFLAVIGIVYIQPLLYPLYQPDSWIMNKVWQLSSVSIAAQLATFSLGLLYFHQFPVYFLVSNLVVIPGSFAVLVGGIALLAVSVVDVLAVWTGKLLSLLIALLNESVYITESLPYSLIDDVYLTTPQSWIILAMVGWILLILQYRKFFYVVMLFVFSLLLAMSFWTMRTPATGFTVYAVNGHSAIDFFNEGKVFSHIDSALAHDTERMRFHIRPNRLLLGTVTADDADDFSRAFPGCYVFRWNDQMILKINDPVYECPDIHYNYIIISHQSVTNIEDVKQFNPDKIILDSSNSYYFANRLLSQDVTDKEKIHSVPHAGSITIKEKL